MAFKLVTVVLAADVADAGTVTLGYPAGTAQADFTGVNASDDGFAVVNDNDLYTEADEDIALAYGGSDITLTNNSGQTWTAGSTVVVQLGQAGGDSPSLEPGDAIANIDDLANNEVGTINENLVVAVNRILIALRRQGIIRSG